MTEVIPIIAALAGGMIAVVGGLLLNKSADHLRESADRRKLTREKLENAYMLSLELEGWATDTLKPPQHSAETDGRNNRIDVIVLICSCYSETCLVAAQALERASEALASNHFKLLLHPGVALENGSASPIRQLEELPNNPAFPL